MELTRDFREVVITSRTQYFPGQEDRDYMLKIPRFDDGGFHTLVKLYLSPFDDTEIRRYLNKKYGRLRFWNFKKKRIAKSIVDSSPKLMVRPMLLSYIDYLVDGARKFTNTYQIYETLIEKWIEREANKRKHESTSREKFKQDLHSFSKLIAVEIYRRFKNTGNLAVDKITATEICRQNGIELQDYEITGQSLLTRDLTHQWKFAHKSILEFLLAKECVGNIDFASEFEFTGMDMAEAFYKGKIPENFELIKGGTFLLGSHHSVKLRSFYMSKYQVTQAEYVNITGEQNPSMFKENNKNPVEQASWFDAIAYCNKLNEKNGYQPVYDKEGNLLDANGDKTTDITQVSGFRLPTEAEWEYAAGGGAENRTEFAGTNDIGELPEYAWSHENSNSKTHPVGQKKPNALGLYDMSGNVWEWCNDWHGDYPTEAQTNPAGPASGSYRVIRGGSWDNDAEVCRVASRDRADPADRDDVVGFRLAFVP